MRGLIIGFGNMGQVHLERYNQLNTHITAVIDSDPDKRRQAYLLGIDVYESLEEYLIQNRVDEIDFIDICLPTDLHFRVLKEVITRFSKFPIPICVEKPIVRTTTEAHELEKNLVNYNALVFVAECEHYNHRISTFINSIKNPVNVRITRMVNLEFFLKGERPWFLDENRSGGLVLDLMVHDFSLLDNIGGAATVASVKSKKIKFNCIDEVTVSLQFKNFTAEVTGSWLSLNIEHPIALIIDVLDLNDQHHHLEVNDYLVSKADDEKLDPYYVELKTFLEGITSGKIPHHFSEYTRVVRLANVISSLLEELRAKDRIDYVPESPKLQHHI